MRRKATCLALLFALNLSALSMAEERPEPNLICRCGWVRFRVVLGRIEVAELNSSQTRATTDGEPDSECFERLLISSDTEIPSLRYECLTPDQTLSIQIINGQQVLIRNLAPMHPERQFALTQVPGQPLNFAVGLEPHQRQYRAHSIWHLMWVARDDFATHLEPVLQAMQPSWRLRKLLSQSEDELLRLAQSNAFSTHRAVRRLVRQLDHESFARRQAADHELRGLGVAALPALNRLDSREFSREQRARLELIRADLHIKQADTPQRVAAWLVEDEAAWVAMLDHPELPVRRLAGEHLAKRIQEPLPFDPAAMPAARAEQVARLKGRLQLR